MRFILLVLFGMSIPSLLLAQYSLNAPTNLPRSGDHLIKKQVSYKAPGNKGSQIVWDFSEQAIEGKDYKLEYNSNAMLDTIQGIEHRTSYCYLFQRDSFLLSNYENPTTLIRLRNPETLLIFPFSYGDTFTDYFDGWGNYCNRLSMDVFGKSTVAADGIGTIILPGGGDTLQNVLRVHTRKEIAYTVKQFFKSADNTDNSIINQDSIECVLAHDSTHLIIDTWRWYVEGYRYPVLETMTNSVCNSSSDKEHFSTSFYYPPLEQYYALDEDYDNHEKRDLQAERGKQKNWMRDAKLDKQYKDEQISYAYYYNSEGAICLDYALYEAAEISICLFDFQGRQLSEFHQSNKSQGSYNEVFWFIRQMRTYLHALLIF